MRYRPSVPVLCLLSWNRKAGDVRCAHIDLTGNPCGAFLCTGSDPGRAGNLVVHSHRMGAGRPYGGSVYEEVGEEE